MQFGIEEEIVGVEGGQEEQSSGKFFCRAAGVRAQEGVLGEKPEEGGTKQDVQQDVDDFFRVFHNEKV